MNQQEHDAICWTFIKEVQRRGKETGMRLNLDGAIRKTEEAILDMCGEVTRALPNRVLLANPRFGGQEKYKLKSAPLEMTLRSQKIIRDYMLLALENPNEEQPEGRLQKKLTEEVAPAEVYVDGVLVAVVFTTPDEQGFNYYAAFQF